MKNTSTLLAFGAIALAAALSASPAAAQATFTASGSGSTCDPQDGLSGTNTPNAFGGVTCGPTNLKVSLEAWGYVGSSFVKGNLGDFGGGGFGAFTGTNESSGGRQQHAFDNMSTNCGSGTDARGYTGTTQTTGGGRAVTGVSALNNGCGGSVEGLLMNFGSKVTFAQLKAGFDNGEGDFSIYAWTGASTGPNMNNQTLNINNATTGLAGWTLISSGDLDNTNPFNVGVNSSSLYSSSFLITTYFGATTNTLNHGDDAFKISGWTVNTCAGTITGGNGGNGGTCGGTPPGRVPEPGSLALVALALIGGAAARRRSQRV